METMESYKYDHYIYNGQSNISVSETLFEQENW